MRLSLGGGFGFASVADITRRKKVISGEKRLQEKRRDMIAYMAWEEKRLQETRRDNESDITWL